MESVTREVRDLGASERSAIERLVGHALGDDQKLVIQVSNGTASGVAPAPGRDKLPDWCRVYEGLSDQQIDELEGVVLKRANLSRSS